jgi:hypothetical protein
MATENIALIVGAGAVENAWNPVIRALQTLYPSNFKLDGNGANSLLANLVYYMRLKPERAKELYQNVKRKIAEHIIESEKNGELKARPELFEIINEFIAVPNSNLLPITTNWDSTVVSAINDYEYVNHFKFSERLSGIYLHGKATEPDSLYLPSEIGDESYRSEQQKTDFREIHAETVKFLLDCDRAILYGISLDPLDAELTATIFNGLAESERLKEIILVNPDFDTVSQRIRVHFIGSNQPVVTPWGFQ